MHVVLWESMLVLLGLSPRLQRFPPHICVVLGIEWGENRGPIDEVDASRHSWWGISDPLGELCPLVAVELILL